MRGDFLSCKNYMAYLLFDIGGTKMRLSVTKDGKDIGETKIVPTPQEFKKGIIEFKKTYLSLAKGKSIKRAVGGIAGPLDKDKKMSVNPPHLPDWKNKPLKEELEKVVSAPLYLENDTAMAGLGEAVFGAAKGKTIVAYMTVSTGVGGARIVDGKIDASTFGFEPGHQSIDADGTIFAEAKPFEGGRLKGHLEGLISGPAIKRRYGEKPEEIEDEKVWDEVASLLAVGLNNTIVHWSPEVIVLGGSLMEKIPFKKVEYNLTNMLKIFPDIPQIKKAKLGDLSGLYGALYYLNNIN